MSVLKNAYAVNIFPTFLHSLAGIQLSKLHNIPSASIENMPVSKEGFGTLDNGQNVHKFVLTNENGVIVEVNTY